MGRALGMAAAIVFHIGGMERRGGAGTTGRASGIATAIEGRSADNVGCEGDEGSWLCMSPVSRLYPAIMCLVLVT